MNRDLFLDAAIAKKPKLEEEIYRTFLDEKLANAITDFENTPSWALTEHYEFLKSNNNNSWAFHSVIRHNNFDPALIEEILENKETDFYYGLVHKENLTRDQLLQIFMGDDKTISGWANFYLTKDTPQAEEFLESELKKKKVEDRSFICTHILKQSKLSEAFVEKLLKKYLKVGLDNYSVEETVGLSLAQNPHLSQEDRAALHLLGYDKVQYRYQEPPYLPSSQLFPYALHQKSPKTNSAVLKALAEAGHPFSIILDEYKDQEVEKSELNLFQLMRSEYLHRAFWSELIGVDGLDLQYRNGYRVQDLFVSHDVLSEAFDASDYDDGWEFGGVLAGYEYRSWIETDETIDVDRAANVLTNFGEALDEVLYNYESLSDLYAPVLAYFVADEADEFIEKYGAHVTSKAFDVITDKALENADQEEFDVEAYLNPTFKETISWKKLSKSKKEQLFEFLAWGLKCDNKDLRNDSEHFLACMALHPATPKNLVEKLAALGNELVTATLARRTS